MADTPCTSAEARQLDFWLGEWDLTWPAEQAGGEPGDSMTGTNRLTKLFGDCVIEENFSTSDESYLGRSLSVYDANAGLWRQTWVDSQGAYLVFTGGMEGDEMILSTAPVAHGDQVVVNRMVFSDITPDSWIGGGNAPPIPARRGPTAGPSPTTAPHPEPKVPWVIYGSKPLIFGLVG